MKNTATKLITALLLATVVASLAGCYPPSAWDLPKSEKKTDEKPEEFAAGFRTASRD